MYYIQMRLVIHIYIQVFLIAWPVKSYEGKETDWPVKAQINTKENWPVKAKNTNKEDWPKKTQSITKEDWPKKTQSITKEDWPVNTQSNTKEDWPEKAQINTKEDWTVKAPSNTKEDWTVKAPSNTKEDWSVKAHNITKEVGSVKAQKEATKDSIDCSYDSSSCHTDIAYCQPKTKLCVCYNGASTYPSCGKRVGTTCEECTDLEYCDLKKGTCMCKWGGFAPDCATKDCGPYAMFLKGECKCMYGKKNDGKDCANCAKNCGSRATCEAGGPFHQECICKYGGKFPNCKKKKVWAKWSTWSKCTTTCGKGTQTRSRKCLNKNGKCKGKYDEKAECDQPVCNVSCKWCKWSEWKRPANSTTCGKLTRSRKPNCPAVSGGGYPCLGQTTQEKEGSDLPGTAAFGTDYHRLDWRKNRFSVTCPGGCFEVTKAVHDCEARDSTEAELKIVRDHCNGKETCEFIPGDDFFGTNNNSVSCSRLTWMGWKCNGNNNLIIYNLDNHDPPAAPYPM